MYKGLGSGSFATLAQTNGTFMANAQANATMQKPQYSSFAKPKTLVDDLQQAYAISKLERQARLGDYTPLTREAPIHRIPTMQPFTQTPTYMTNFGMKLYDSPNLLNLRENQPELLRYQSNNLHESYK